MFWIADENKITFNNRKKMKWRKSVRLKEHSRRQLDFVASVTDSRAQKIFAAHTHIYWIWLDSKLFCCQTQVANAMEIWTKSVAVVYRWDWASIWSSNCFVRSESPVHLMNGRKGDRFFIVFFSFVSRVLNIQGKSINNL